MGSWLDGDVSDAASGRQGRRSEGRGSGLGEGRKKELGAAGLIEQTIPDQRIIDRQGTGNKDVGVDLAGSTKDNAVLIDNIDLAGSGDAPKDLGGTAAGVIDLVESSPLPHAFLAIALVEVQVGVLANIKSLPVQQGLLLGLFNDDLGFSSSGSLGREEGTGPEGEVGADAGSDLEAARGEAVRHVGELLAGVVGIGSRIIGPSSGAGGVLLGALHGFHGPAGAGEGVLGIAAGSGGLGGSGVGPWGAVGDVRAGSSPPQDISAGSGLGD